MSWPKRLWPFSKAPVLPDALFQIHFALSGWTEQPPDRGYRIWHGTNGGVLSLAEMDSGFWFSASGSEIRDIARKVAGDQQGGLVELKTVHGATNRAVRFIYKRLQGLGYVFTGMFFVRTAGGPVVWTIVEEFRRRTF